MFRPLSRIALMVVLIAASGVAACGRAGPLEPPPSAQAAPPPAGKDGKPTATAQAGQPAASDAPTPAQKHFILDFLLN